MGKRIEEEEKKN